MEEIATLKAALSGRYDVERQLGQGGMATVYLARDVRHDRHVAVKVLRPELAAVIGAQRFLTEIRIVAGLQHPHILPLHDSGEANGTVFYVMPFVEGETLRDRLKRERQLPVDEAVRIAREVASALDYAHRHDVVHRDIKPENILLHDGQALVADFGIALAVSRSDDGTRMTETGMSLGTPHYMAPEQAMGEREITVKADVYALGCVLYEMLTGEPPFTGATAQAVVARALTESPRSITIQRHTVPAHVEAAVTTALEKLPADRFATAGEFAQALANPAYRFDSATAAHASRQTGRAVLRSPVVLTLAVIALASTTSLAWLLLRPVPSRPVTRFGMTFPRGQEPLPDTPFALSPDGSKLLYVGPGPGSNQLWLKARDQLEAAPLGVGTSGSFAFASDGGSVVFTDGSRLKTLQLSGGGPVTVADTVSFTRGVAGFDDGSIAFVNPSGRRLQLIGPSGGSPRSLWEGDTTTAWYPAPLPGSRGLLFIECGAANSCGLVALDLAGSTIRRIVPNVGAARYVTEGYIVYVRLDGALFALRFSATALSASGSPIPVQEGVAVIPWVQFDVANDGTLLTRAGAGTLAGQPYQMVWIDRTGAESVIDSSWTVRLTWDGNPPNVGWSLSPDAKRLAVGQHTDAGDDIWVKHLPHGPDQRVTFDSAADFRPRWTRDGSQIVFSSRRRSGTPALFRRNADATGADSLVFYDPRALFEGLLSGDGRFLLLRTGGTQVGAGGRDISILELGVDTTPRPLIATPFDEEAIALSPDGHWIAYESDETGRTEVYVRPFPETDKGKQQVSTDGGQSPLWARNDRELFYVNGARSVVAVPITSAATLQLGQPRTLFHLRDDIYLQKNEYYTPFDVTPDGQRFVFARRLGSAAEAKQSLVMVTNWFEELKAKVK